jgi:hypothetical protein
MVSEVDVDENGIIESSALALIQVSWSAFYTALVAGHTLPVLLHADGSTPNAITGFIVESVIATQRRRLRR